MKLFVIALASVFGIAAVLAVVGVVTYFSYSNTEIGLRNEAKAQQEKNEAVFDTTWKIISQQCQIKDDYKDSFRATWKDLMEAQSSGARTASLSVFVNKINPNFDASVFKKVMNTVESERKNFLNGQTKLLDIQREHENITTKFPGSLICSGRPPLKVVIVTSSKTQDTFESGKEDDVNLSEKK